MTATDEQIDYDPASGRKAFEQLESILRALPAERLTPASARVGKATAYVLAVVRDVRTDQAAYEALPGIDRQLIRDLEPAAWAAWYVQTELQDTQAVRTGVKVPESVIGPATERRARMLRTLEYNFGDQPRVARRLESIRSGQGYDDLASDLARLARLQRRYAADFPAGDKWYVAEDADLADGDVKAILLALSTEVGNDWAELRTRTWSYLLRCYNEVSAAAQWLHRNEPEAANRFASLYTIGRASAGRSRQVAEPPPEPVQETVIDV
jgi:hypothetical protein